MHKKKYDSLIILIPSFNELNNLKKFIKDIHKRYKVLIIDDCSSDNTSTWLKKNKRKFKEIILKKFYQPDYILKKIN